MADALTRAEALLARYDEELRAELPEGADVYDAHTHLGNDIDGMRGAYDELIATLDHYGISRCNVFCLDEPDRHPAFRAANDRTLAYAERAGGRLVPFVRLDLAEQPIEEATRCLDAGARGIKLHPRAQGFLLDDKRLAPVFELAADRRVPILIHGGRGLPPIADHLHRLVERYAGARLIIAHGGIADMAALAERFAGRSDVFFDTSVWSPIDLLDFFHRVPPEQILWASDYPYGQEPSSLLNTLRTARTAGLDDQDVRNLLAGNASRLANGEAPLAPTSPRGSATFSQAMPLARVHQYLSMAMPLLWTRQPDTVGVLGLAINVCGERNGFPDEMDRIKELLIAARELWREAATQEDAGDPRRLTRMTFRLVHLADIWAVTTPV